MPLSSTPARARPDGSLPAARPRGSSATLPWQCLIGVGLLALWEVAGAYSSSWVSRPSLVGHRLWVLSTQGLAGHVSTTLGEVVIGLAIGSSLGIVSGIVLGRSKLVADILRPILVALYSLPHITLIPIFIMYLGLDMAPKIVLVATVCYFLLLFSTMTGARSVDEDMISALRAMGAGRREVARKIILPACLVWIVSAFKVALPYSLVAATAGEILAARRGIGFLVSESASEFDMAGLYACLLLLMALGLLFAQVGTQFEKRTLRWQNARR